MTHQLDLHDRLEILLKDQPGLKMIVSSIAPHCGYHYYSFTCPEHTLRSLMEKVSKHWKCCVHYTDGVMYYRVSITNGEYAINKVIELLTTEGL